MRKVVKKYIIPHQGNNHTPHLLREAGVIGMLALIMGLFVIALGQTVLLQNTNLAAVLTPVLVDLTNADRQTRNISPLTLNPVLVHAAQMKANDMAAKGYFAHNSPDGLSPWHWFEQVGYKFMYAGENLAVNFTESTDVERAWMDSPGHRANILNEKFTEIGIATQQGMYQGQNAIFVAQMFGRPLPTRAATVAQRVQVKPKATITVATSTRIAGQVKSEATSTPKTEEQEVKTIISKDMFIAVERVSTTSAPIENYSPTAGTTETVKYASAIEKALTQPKLILMYVYSFISALILLVIGLMVMGEYKRHHMKHVTYGAGLLVAMAILVYTLSTFIPNVIVV
jgi:uncharacterized protein YkwD